MVKIAASLHSGPKLNLQETINGLKKAGVDLLHIDVMDGNFVPKIDFGANTVKEISDHTDIPLDIHMMVQDPIRLIKDYVFPTTYDIGIHVESTRHIHRDIKYIQSLGKRAEIIINPGTSIEAIRPMLGIVDQVMVMTVDPGFGGTGFIPLSIKRVQKLDDIRRENNYTYKIEVDGAISDQNIQKLKKAGVDVAVSGSFVFKGKFKDQITKLR